MIRKRKLFHLMMALLLVVSLAPSLSSTHPAYAADPPEIVVPNAGFETLAGQPAEWIPLAGTRYEAVTDVVYEGAYSVKMTDTSGNASGGLRSPYLPAAAGVPYEASVNAFTESGHSHLYLEFWNGAQYRIGVYTTDSLSTEQWERLAIAGTAPAGTVYVTVLLYQSIENVGTAYFDHASLLDNGGEQAVPNAGFEQLINAKPAVWSPLYSTTYETVTDIVYAGTYSVKLTDPGSTVSGGLRSPNIDVLPDHAYKAEAYAYNATGNSYLYVEFWDRSQNRIGVYTKGSVLTGEWERLEVSGTAPADTAYATVLLYQSLENVGVAYFDAVSLRETTVSEPEGPPLMRTVISDFENETDQWAVNLGQEYPGALGGFERDSANAHTGNYAGKLWGDFSGGGAYVSVYKGFAPLDMRDLRLAVQTSDLSAIHIRVVDSTGQYHQQKLTLRATSDWQQLQVNQFDSGAEYIHWGGANDGVWHGPAIAVHVLFNGVSLTGGKQSGTLRIDDVTATVPVPELTIGQTKLGNVFTEGEPVAFNITTSGDSVAWAVYDFWGNRVAGGNEAVTGRKVALLPPVSQKGYYTLNIAAQAGGVPFRTTETTFALLSSFDLGQVDDSPFGIGTHFVWWDPDQIPLIRKAGIKNVRDEMPWDKIEVTKGVYQFPARYDTYMQALAQNGIKPFIVLDYSNPNYDGGKTPYTAEGREGYANYGTKLLGRYGEQMEWVEIYNEFNLKVWGGNGPADSKPEYYYELLKAAYEKLKAQDPNVKVVGPTTNGVPLDWLEKLFQLGGLPYMDAVSIHPYRLASAPEVLANDLIDVQNLIKTYNNGQSKPIWITEMSWITGTDNLSVDEKTQAAYLARSIVLALSQGVEKYFWYDFMNDGLDPNNNENNFGIIRHQGDAKGKYAPKPAYAAYAALTRQLTGAQFQERETVSDNVYSFRFNKNGEDVRAIWSTEPKLVTVKTNTPVVVTDVVGNGKTYYPEHGNVYLSVTGNPLYVSGAADGVAAGSGYSLAGGEAFVGDPIKLTLTVDNTLSVSDGVYGTFAIGGQSFPVAVAPGQLANIPITLPAPDATGSLRLIGDLVVNGHPVGRLEAGVNVRKPLDMRVAYDRSGSEPVAIVTIDNLTNRSYGIDSLNWKVGERSGTANVQATIPMGAQRIVELPLGELTPSRTNPVVLTLIAEGAPLASFAGSVTLLAKQTVTVDGSLDEWSAIPAIDPVHDGHVAISNYGGANDLSGNVWVTWDENNLYFSAKVHDDVQAQTETGERIWIGDSIQLALAPGMPGAKPAWYEFGMALTSAGPQLYRSITAGDPVGPVSGAQLAITRDETNKDTVYELALPWSDLSPLAPEQPNFSLSFLINDNDGAGRKGWVEWGAGIGGSKDPKAFRAVLLAQAAKDQTPPITVAAVSETQGANNWYVSNVSVALSANDDNSGVTSTEYALTVVQSTYDLQSTPGFVPYTTPIVLSDGVYGLRYRSTDNAGNIEDVKSLALQIDATAPTVTVTANGSPLSDGAEFQDSQPISFAVQTADNLSGIAQQVVTVDGTAYVPGTALDWAGKLGAHVIQVAVTDQAGNVTQSAITVNVKTSYNSLEQLLNHYAASGALSGPLQNQLANKFAQAKDQLSKGHNDQAIKHLEDFLKLIHNPLQQNNISAEAKAALVADVNDLIQP